MYRSIRWRLVVSYALITLLTVSAVGVFTLSLVQRYMNAQEAEYLTANAQSVARSALLLMEENPRMRLLQAESPEQSARLIQPGQHSPNDPTLALTQLVQTAAFLGNVQIKILDANGDVLIDSGGPGELNELAWLLSPLPVTERTGNEVAAFNFSRLPPMTFSPISPFALNEGPGTGDPAVHHFPPGRLPSGDFAPGADLLRSALQSDRVAQLHMGETGYRDVFIIRTHPGRWGNRLVFDVSSGALLDEDVQQSAATAPPQSDTEPASSGETSQIADPLRDDAAPSRSEQVMIVPIGDADQPLGFVELSNGPNFSADAVEAIRSAFVVAAGGVSLLSVIVGLLVGRGLTAPLLSLTAATRRMSSGDLSTRATIRSRDEIGQLATQFNQMAARLETSFAELAAERDSLRRFIADASHELRTPITALKTFNELLQGPAAADDNAQAEFLRESQHQIEKLEWITSHLLDLSRLDAGLVELSLAPQDIGELLDAAVAPFRLRAAEMEIHLGVQRPDPPATFVCDRARMELTLTNLLDNALKFTPAHGRVEIGATADASCVRFWVQDSGTGIAPEEIPRIFDRFYQAAGTPQGSGLGLAIVQSVVRAHGGRVHVESAPGTGSRFDLALPLNPPRATENP